MPAFVRTIRESNPGYGSASLYGLITAANAANTPVNIIIPATGATTPAGGTAFNVGGQPPPTRGRGRIRTTAVNAATIDTFTVTVTDGTTTEVVFIMGPTAAGALVDLTFDFNTDLNITSSTLNIVQAGATQQATVDFELSLL